MRLYTDANERFRALAGRLEREGRPVVMSTDAEAPAGQTYKRCYVEVLGEVSGLRDARDCLPLGQRGVSWTWLGCEVAAYLDPRAPLPILAWKSRATVERFHRLRPDGRLRIPYGVPLEAIWRLAGELRRAPESRRVVVSFQRRGAYATADETPCALTSQFLLREGRLWSINTYRSHDLFAGVRTDTARCSVVQQALAALLGVEPGPLVFEEGSLHYYPGRRHAPLYTFRRRPAGRVVAPAPPLLWRRALPRTEASMLMTELERFCRYVGPLHFCAPADLADFRSPFLRLLLSRMLSEHPA